MRTFGTAKLDGEMWKLKVEPHVSIRLKRLFQRLDGQFGTLTVRDSDETCCDLRWFMERYPLEISGEDRAHMGGEADLFNTRTAEFSSILKGDLAPREFEMAVPLRSYQASAAELILRTRGLLVADDLGVGKSAVGIAMITDVTARPALVVTLTHLPKQWAREIEKFVPGLRVHVITKGTAYDIATAMSAPHRRKKRRRKKDDTQATLLAPSEMEGPEPEFPDVVIINYHKLAGWSEALAPKIRSIVFDEVQELRRHESNKYGAAEHLAQRADYVLGLSATPVYNYGGEMFNIMHILKPDVLGTWGEFSAEWCGPWADRTKARIKDPKAFGTYLRESGLMIRRTRKDVDRELPALVKVPHYVESDPAALDKIEADVAELARLVLDTNTTRLQRRDAAGELDWKLRQATGIAKAPYVADFVKMLIESGVRKVLLLGWHRETYEIWKSKLKAYAPEMYTGSESPRQKEKAFDLFNDPESKCQVLMMSLRAGAGLDGLQYGVCTTIVHGELDWSPAVHDQCNGRPHRDGQTSEVTAYYMLSDEGSDPVISDMLGIKRAQIEGVRDPMGAIVEKAVDGGSRIRKLAEQLLEKRAGG